MYSRILCYEEGNKSNIIRIISVAYKIHIEPNIFFSKIINVNSIKFCKYLYRKILIALYILTLLFFQTCFSKLNVFAVIINIVVTLVCIC